MPNNQITVFVGDVTKDLSDRAKQHDPDAQRITIANHHNLSCGTYFVSVGDLENLYQFATVLRQAQNIYYHPPQSWSDRAHSHPETSMQNWTEQYLDVFACDPDKTIVGWQPRRPAITEESIMLQLCDTRKQEDKQIWIAGCSISHGDGVLDHERYGAIIAQHLALPVSFLTASGSSVAWASDQILRSDIRSGDTIFWGITSYARFSYLDEMQKKIRHCPVIRFNWPQNSYLQNLVRENFFCQ